jgi:hypothetical protein
MNIFIWVSSSYYYEVIASTDKNGNKMAVNWGSNPGAGVQKMSFQQEKKPCFFKKYFLNILPP